MKYRILQLALIVLGLSSLRPAVAHAESRTAALARDEGWLALGHWQRTWLGGMRSAIDPGPFFLAPDGREDPEAELDATIAAMAAGALVGPQRLPAPCALPARAAYLRRHGWPLAKAACPDFAFFKDKLAVRNASLVFASAYANNPASMFGHVVLRLDRRAPGVTSHLLDNSVAFLAQVGTDDDPFSYAYKGVTGGYPGAFLIDPYYVTVATYNDGESRDLWEYDLNLTEPEVQLLVEHIWEVATLARFPYFFAHGNCAYHILAVIAAARPSAHLMEKPGAIVLPLEIARQVHAQFGAVGDEVRWRPSLKRQLQSSLKRLSVGERERFEDLRAKAGQGLTQEASPLVVDALIAYLNFKKFDTHNRLSEEQRQAFRAALVRRSQLDSSNEPEFVEVAPTAPDAGHLPAQLRVGGGMRQHEGFAEVSVKAGLHDFLRDDSGYESFAAIDYLDAAVRYYASKQSLQVDHLTVISVNSLAPFSLVSKDWSWRAGLEWQQIAERPYGGALAHQLRGELGGGLTWGFFDNRLSIYDLAVAAADLSPAFYHGLRLGPGLTVGVVAHLGAYRLLGEWTARRDFIHGEDSRMLTIGQSLTFSRSWDLRADWHIASGRKVAGSQREGQVSVGFSF